MVTTARDYHDLDFIIRATDLSGISTYISFIKYQHFLLVFNRLRFSVSGEILKQRHFLLRRKERFSFGLGSVWQWKGFVFDRFDRLFFAGSTLTTFHLSRPKSIFQFCPRKKTPKIKVYQKCWSLLLGGTLILFSLTCGELNSNWTV